MANFDARGTAVVRATCTNASESNTTSINPSGLIASLDDADSPVCMFILGGYKIFRICSRALSIWASTSMPTMSNPSAATNRVSGMPNILAMPQMYS